MLLKSTLALAAAAGAMAQRPSDVSICDYYAPKYFDGANSPINQYSFMNVLVNRFAFGGYKFTDGTPITGFLTPGNYMGKPVNLLPHFNGGLASANQGGSHGVAINIATLDATGRFPVQPTFTPNGTNEKQNVHLTHVYPYFGTVIGCSQIGQDGFPPYIGPNSIYEVHKFMNLGPEEVGYFINQIGLSLLSMGVDDADVAMSNTTFDGLFNYRCLPPYELIKTQGSQKGQGAQNSSICQRSDCPIAPNNPMCPDNQPGEPMTTNWTTSFGQGSSLCAPHECDNAGDEVMIDGTNPFSNSTALANGSQPIETGSPSAPGAPAPSTTIATAGAQRVASAATFVAFAAGVVAFML